MKIVSRLIRTSRRYVRRKLLELLVITLPKISREQLIELGRRNNTISVVEEEYVCEIPPQPNSLTALRFGNLVGRHKIPCFFGIVLSDIRLIGPYGIPVTRSGKIVLEPIAESWLPTVLRRTINELGIFRLTTEYLLAIFPRLNNRRSDIPFAAHLLCRGAERPGRGPVYGHWFGEQIPQLRAIEAIQEESAQEIKLIIDGDSTDWQTDSLEMIGYQSSSIIKHSSPGVRVKKLVISSLRHVHSTNMELDPKARQWAARRVRESASVNAERYSDSNRKVAYLRTNQRDRAIVNISEIRETLLEYGYFEDSD